jgi:hypothetical protein
MIPFVIYYWNEVKKRAVEKGTVVANSSPSALLKYFRENQITANSLNILLG